MPGTRVRVMRTPKDAMARTMMDLHPTSCDQPPRHVRVLRDLCAQRGVQFSDITYPMSGGTNRALVLIPPGPVRHAVLVCHSLGSDRFYPFTQLFLHLTASSHPVFSMDLCGHGQHNQHPFTLSHVEEALPQTLTAVEQCMGVEPGRVILLGHSLGGALCLAESARNACRAVITISAPHAIHHTAWNFLEALSILSPHVLNQLRYYSWWELLPAFGTFKRDVYPCRTSGGVATYLQDVAAVVQQLGLRERVQRSQIPWLQVHGRMDVLVPARQAHHLREWYGGTCKQVMLPWSNHMTTLFHPACVHAVLHWLRELTQERNS